MGRFNADNFTTIQSTTGTSLSYSLPYQSVAGCIVVSVTTLSDVVTGVTANGSTMNQSAKVVNGVTVGYLYTFSPTILFTGSVTIVVSTSGSVLITSEAACYSSKSPSSLINASNANTGTLSTSLTTLVTTLADMCILVGVYAASTGTHTAGSGTEFLNSGGTLCDSNGQVGTAGSHSLTVNNSGAATNVLAVIALTPTNFIGLLSPTSVTDLGDGSDDWGGTEANVEVVDRVYASSELGGIGDRANTLKCVGFNFGSGDNLFPANILAITGVVVVENRYFDNSGDAAPKDNGTSILIGGTASGTSLDSGAVLSESYQTVIFGGDSVTGGLTITTTQASNSNFGVNISIKKDSLNSDTAIIRVDSIQMGIFYSTTGGGTSVRRTLFGKSGSRRVNFSRTISLPDCPNKAYGYNIRKNQSGLYLAGKH